MAKAPFPKKNNDFRPVAFISNILKCLDDIIRNYFCDRMEILRDPMQFAYCECRSVQDVSIIFMSDVCNNVYLEKKKYINENSIPRF